MKRPKLPEGTPRCIVHEQCARPSLHTGPCIDGNGLALPAPEREPIVRATCRSCDWTAEHKRGDTIAEDMEIAKLMRRLVLEHQREKHSDTWKNGN